MFDQFKGFIIPACFQQLPNNTSLFEICPLHNHFTEKGQRIEPLTANTVDHALVFKISLCDLLRNLVDFFYTALWRIQIQLLTCITVAETPQSTPSPLSFGESSVTHSTACSECSLMRTFCERGRIIVSAIIWFDIQDS